MGHMQKALCWNTEKQKHDADIKSDSQRLKTTKWYGFLSLKKYKHAPQYDNMKNSGKYLNYKCSKGNLKNSHALKCGKIGNNFTLKKKF